MDEPALKRLLRLRDRPRNRPGWRCLGDGRLAAYAGGTVSVRERARVERHLSVCDACMEQVAFLGRVALDATAQTVSPDLLVRAKALPEIGPRRQIRFVVRWAPVAAGVCLVLAFALRERPPVTPAPPETPATPARATPEAVVTPDAGRPAAPPAAALPIRPPATERSHSLTAAPFVLTSPDQGAAMAADRIEFAWRTVAGALYYEVVVVTEDGSVVWQAQADATRAQAPPSHGLQAGVRYFVWVRAFLADGRTVRSAAVTFNIAGS